MTSASGWRSFGRSLTRNKWSLLVILLAVFLIHSAHLLEPIELPFMDAWQRQLPPIDAQYVRLVAIDEGDYETLFGRKRPLDPSTVAQLLDVIARARPLAIGVDLKTDDPTFAQLAERTDWGAVIWAREGEQHGGTVVPSAILGGRTPVPPNKGGIALAVKDRDSVIRRLPRTFDTAAGPRSSFHWAIVETACAAQLDAPACHEGRAHGPEGEKGTLVNLYHRRLQLLPMRASEVIGIGAQRPTDGPDAFKDRIVLLGGTFKDGRDDHETPIGTMSGLEAWGHAVETELASAGVEDVSPLWLTLADALIAVLMIWLHHFVGGKRAFIVIIVVIPLAMMGLSLLLFRIAGLVLTFVPIFVAIFLHQLWDDYRHSPHTHAL